MAEQLKSNKTDYINCDIEVREKREAVNNRVEKVLTKEEFIRLYSISRAKKKRKQELQFSAYKGTKKTISSFTRRSLDLVNSLKDVKYNEKWGELNKKIFVFAKKGHIMSHIAAKLGVSRQYVHFFIHKIIDEQKGKESYYNKKRKKK